MEEIPGNTGVTSQKSTRRKFLSKSAALAIAAPVVLSTGTVGCVPVPAEGFPVQSSVGSAVDVAALGTHNIVEINGQSAGFLTSASGGSAVATVQFQPQTGKFQTKASISTLKFEPFTLKFGTGMTKPFYDWIEVSLDSTNQLKDGSIIIADQNFKETKRYDFLNGRIIEVEIPALDGASKDAAHFGIKIAPESVNRRKGNNVVKTLQSKSTKRVVASNFRLKIDGLDDATKRTSKIDAIRATHGDEAGTLKDIWKFSFTTSEADADKLFEWHDDFVIKGNNTTNNERNGSIEIFAADLKEVLFTISLFGLGIYRIDPVVPDSPNEAAKVKATMYFNRIQLKTGAGAIAK